MRLLIYLLAMMTGFSAAEAARPVSATPATLGAAVAQAAVVVVSLPADSRTATAADSDQATLLRSELVLGGFYLKAVSRVFVSPVTRHDITLQ